jgi:hypothetical protein
VAKLEVTFEKELTADQTASLEKLVADEVVAADDNLQPGDVIAVATKQAGRRRLLAAVKYDVAVKASPTKAAVLKSSGSVTVAKLTTVTAAVQTKSAAKVGVAITAVADPVVVEIILPTKAPTATATQPTSVVFSAAGSVAPYLATVLAAVAAPFFL